MCRCRQAQWRRHGDNGRRCRLNPWCERRRSCARRLGRGQGRRAHAAQQADELPQHNPGHHDRRGQRGEHEAALRRRCHSPIHRRSGGHQALRCNRHRSGGPRRWRRLRPRHRRQLRGVDARGLRVGRIDHHGRLERHRTGGRGHGRCGQGPALPHALMNPRRHRCQALQRSAQLGHVLRPFERAHAQRPAHRIEKALRDTGHHTLLDRLGVVLHRPRRRWGRRNAEQQKVHDGAQRVEIGPRALAHLRHFGVLLDRRVAGFQDRGERLRAVADDMARGAEVEQDRLAHRRQQDVVGRDVAVVHAFVVQQLQRVEHRVDHPENPGFVGRVRHGLARVAQRDALQVGHHHVGGGVVFPEPVDLHQRRVVEAGQQTRFVDERTQPDRVGLGERGRAHRDHRPHTARGERRRHVFLQRDLALQRVVLGEVDDAEAAHPEHPQDLELAEACAGWQRIVFGHRDGGRRAGGGVVAHAVGARGVATKINPRAPAHAPSKEGKAR